MLINLLGAFNTNLSSKSTTEEIEKTGGYDGNQLLIENLSYNPESNQLYVVAKRAKYSFIRTLQKSPQDGGFGPEHILQKNVLYSRRARTVYYKR